MEMGRTRFSSRVLLAPTSRSCFSVGIGNGKFGEIDQLRLGFSVLQIKVEDALHLSVEEEAMVFWYRLHQSKLRHASSYIKSCYAQSVYASAHDCAASSASIGVKPAPLADIRRRPTDFCSNVRFFAAPVQVMEETA